MDDVQTLDAQIAELMKRREAVLASKRAEVLAAVKQQIAEYGLTAKELGVAGKKGKGKAGDASVVKYRNPTNPELGWTGKGRKPFWVNDFLASGGTLEQLEAH